MKRAIAIQFTWIFVLIVGGLLFAFFMNVVANQKKMADDKSSVSLKNEMSSLLRLAEAGTDSFNRHEVHETTMYFECEEPSTSSLSIGARRATENIENSILFTQEELTGQVLYTWALDWKIPYHAGTFLYLTNDRTKYVFVKGSTTTCQAFAQKMYNLMPSGMKKSLVLDASSIPSEGYSDFVIITHSSCTLTSTEEEGIENRNEHPKEIYFVEVNPTEQTVNFKKPRALVSTTGSTPSSDGQSNYFRDEMLVGAFFAPQKDLFDCTVQKAFKRAMVVSELNYRRLEDLDANIRSSGKPWCDTLYGSGAVVFSDGEYPLCGNVKIFENALKEIRDPNLVTGNDKWSYDVSTSGVYADAPCTGNALKRLEGNYNRLIRETRDISLVGDCPYIY